MSPNKLKKLYATKTQDKLMRGSFYSMGSQVSDVPSASLLNMQTANLDLEVINNNEGDVKRMISDIIKNDPDQEAEVMRMVSGLSDTSRQVSRSITKRKMTPVILPKSAVIKVRQLHLDNLKISHADTSTLFQKIQKSNFD